MTSGSLRARASVVAHLGPGGGTHFRELRSAPPLSLRRAAGSVWMVGTAAGPLPGDRVSLGVEVGAGAELVLRSTAATVALGDYGDIRSELVVDAEVAAGGALWWLPEPTVATAGCHHRSTARIHLTRGARLMWRDELVLGRHGEEPGRLASRIEIESDGMPLLRQELRVGPGAPGWQGPSVTGGAGAVGMMVVFDGGQEESVATSLAPELATLPLAGGGVLVSALGLDAAELRHRLEAGAARLGGGR